MINFVYVKEDGNIGFTKVNGNPQFVNHPKVLRSWAWGCSSNGVSTDFISFLMDNGNKTDIEVHSTSDAIQKANQYLNTL